MTISDDMLPHPELCTPSHLYVRSDARRLPNEDDRIALHAANLEFAPDLAELQEMDPESYRMVVYSWA